MDTTATVKLAQNVFCTTPLTTFTDGCAIDGSHDGVNGNVLDVRTKIVTDCRPGGSEVGNAVCNLPIEGTSGTTVADCILNPFLTDNGCHVNDAFTDVKLARNQTCTTPGTSFNQECDIESATNTNSADAGNIRAARGAACVGLSDSERATRGCGSELGGGKEYIQAYCATGNAGGAHNNARDCPTTAYADANPNLSQSDNVSLADFTTSDKNQPLNSTGTALLPAFATPQNSLSEHGDANFIDGLRDSLLLTPFSTQTLSNDSTLTLGALADTPAPTNDGFALGTITTTVNGAKKLYVGFLSNTSLGNPVTDAVSGTWTGKLRLLVGAGAEDFNITLNVNVTAKTITEDGTRPDITAFNSSFGTINIDGKFTANGVIYGTVDFGEPNGNNTVATLTGLIGAEGAVGIFRSNSDATTAYVGGFVAEKSAVPANCLADAMPFDLSCTDDSVRFRLCNGLIADLEAAGGSPTPSDCNKPTLSGEICGTGTGEQSIPGENPFAQICFDNKAYPVGFQPIVAQRVFAEKCASGVQTTNCDKSATGIVDAKSVIECARKPYDDTDNIRSCKFNPVFNGIRMALDGICRSGGTNPFDSDCTDAEYPDLAAEQESYCEATATTWSNSACDNESLYGTTKDTRDAACLADGITGTGHASCADRRNVLDACNENIFKKIGNDSNVLLCTGTSDSADLGNKPYLTLQGECVAEDTSFASYCNMEDNNDGGSDTAVKMARDAVCLRKVATAINGGNNDCPGRANVLAECTTSGDPFSRTGCDTANGIAGIRTTYCTTNAAKIFDPQCDGDVYGGAGVTSKARATACNDGSALDHESGENITNTTCGNEDTADSGVLYTYCQAYAADDETNCPNTFRIVQNTECENTDPWGSDCDNITHHSARKARCATDGTIPASALSGTDRETLCNAVELVTCRSGGVNGGITVVANPFDTSCGNTYDNDRATACAVTGSAMDDQCTATVLRICGTNADVFNSACLRDTTGATYHPARLTACGGTLSDLTDAGGSLVGCNTAELSGAICASTGADANPFAPICSEPTATAHNVGFDQVAVQVTFCNANSGNSECGLPAWKLHARNTDDTGRLDVLAADGVNQNNPLTNYVVGTVDGLNLGFNQSAGSVPNNISRFAIGGLKLSDLDSVDAPAGDTDGVSFATFANADTTDTTGGSDGTGYNAPRYYAGLWNGTDLGAPLNSTGQSATWKGKIALVTSSALYSTVGFDLVVEFGGTDGNTLIAKDIPLTANEDFTINGKFTSAGVIYGTTSFESVGFESTGSLTGLIGVKGAVGAFVSTNETTNAAGEYAGGFVAAPIDEGPVVVVNCTADGEAADPFNAACTSSTNYALQAQLCRDNGTTPVTGFAGADFNTNCVMNIEVTNRVCATRGTYANPFNDVCANQNDVKLQVCRGALSDLNAVGGSLESCNNAELSGEICASMGANANPFSPICSHPGATAYNPNFDRDATVNDFCQDTTSNSGANPFNPGCGSGLYDVARGAACVAGFVHSDCGAEGTPDTYINAFCGSEAGKTEATGCPVRFAFIENIKFCMDGTQSTESRCMNPDVAAITGPCLLDPFVSECAPYAAEYEEEREARLTICRGSIEDIGDTPCNKTRPTICAATATPFAPVCSITAGKWFNQQTTLVNTCAADEAREVEACKAIIVNLVTVADCIENPFRKSCPDTSLWEGRQTTIVDNCAGDSGHADCLVTVGSGSTVASCIADPFNGNCSAAAFTNQRNAVCDVAETSFNAHCLASDEIAGTRNGTPKDISAERARRALVANCSDTDTANNTGCDTPVLTDKSTTLAQCIANPFLADCSADVIYRTLLSSTDAVAKRDALLAKCAADAMPTDADCIATIAGGQTIANCIANPFHADCSVTDMTSDAFAAFGAYRAPVCTTAATSFRAECDEVTYPGTDTARAELALSCAVDSTGTGCGAGTIMVSASLTVNACNTDPFAEGCESPAFINARLESCKGASPHANCSVATGQGQTNYVAGSETSLEGIYVEDNDQTTQNETYVYVEDNPDTPSIHEGAAYVKQANGVDYVVATRTVRECMYVLLGEVCKDVQQPIADNPDTPINESRVRVANNPDTDVDESRIRITQDDPNTYLDETRALVDNSVQASGLTLADAGEDGNAAAGFVIAYLPTGRDANTGVAGTDRYYAGLLSTTTNTNVGGVLTADDFPMPDAGNDVKGEWTAKLAIINNGRAVETADFKLDVNFTAKTLGASNTRTTITEVVGVPTQMIDPLTQQLEVDSEGQPVLRSTITTTSKETTVNYASIAGGRFVIDGKFTAQGVIYGTTRLGDGLTDGESSRGTLTGLIGAQGAVGAFVSSGEGVNVNGFGEFAGGFVAVNPDYVETPVENATFTTWAASFAEGELLAEDGVEATVASATEGTDSSHFIRGSATGIDGIYTEFSGGLARVTGLRLSDADTDNGVAFGYVTTGTGDNTALHFAGLLSGADVGAPITNVVTDVLWTGNLAGFIDEKRVNNSILGSTLYLRISFTGDRGTIINWNGDGDPEESQGDAAAVSVGNSRFLSLVGGFTSAGLLTGTVKTGTNGVVTQGIQSGTFNGIIGQDGLLAVFKSDATNTVHFAGGFAAVPGRTAPNSPFEVNVQAPEVGGGGGGTVTESEAYKKWATSLGNDLRASDYTPPAANSVDFIRLGANDAILATSPDDIIPGLLHLDGSTTAGVAYGSGGDIDNGIVQLYAGLLPGTDVGAGTDLGVPIAAGFTTATWEGTLKGIDIAGSAGAVNVDDFNMEVTFAGASGTIRTLTPYFTTGGGQFFYIGFNGTFDAMGVMSGNVTDSSGQNAHGTFNGLIGVKGAVGAFKGINSAGDKGYVGGFQVKPPAGN